MSPLKTVYEDHSSIVTKVMKNKNDIKEHDLTCYNSLNHASNIQITISTHSRFIKHIYLIIQSTGYDWRAKSLIIIVYRRLRVTEEYNFSRLLKRKNKMVYTSPVNNET